jgi:hypothetical protein
MGRDVQDWDLKVFLAKQYFNQLKEDATNSVLYMLKNRKGKEREIYRQKMEMLRIETCNEAGILGVTLSEVGNISRNQKESLYGL